LKELQVSSNRRLSNLANRQIVISHDGFLYLAKEFGLVVTAIIEKTPGVEPDHADIVKTINIIRNEEPKAIFIDGSRPSQAAKTIFEHTGLHIFELDMAITGPPEKDAYIRAMEKNVSTLKGVLN
jgi:zinc transport system substrate-binding protein